MNQLWNLANIEGDSQIELTIQWIPRHVDLTGNEQVNGLAKTAHDLEMIKAAMGMPT